MQAAKAVKVLIIDDDPQRRHDLKTILDFLGDPAVASSHADWQEEVRAQAHSSAEFMAVLLGDPQKRQSIRSRLQQIWEWDRGCPVILTGADEVEAEWEPYLKQIVLTRLELPLTYARLVDTLHRAQRYREASSVQMQQGGGRPVHLFRSLVGSSRRIQDLRKIMARVAEQDVPVLITGESGTGKEVVARNLHYRSSRTGKTFVPVDCRAIPEELLESELFGHEAGAFPGATEARPGRLEMAHGGTLFLDGIGDLPAGVQVKILRLLKNKCIQRLGGTESVPVDVRLVTATHHNLDERVQSGQFLDELYYAVNVFPIETPPLRERVEDIPLLINELVSRLEGEKRGSIRFNSAAILSLCRHDWPGNVRELANLVERMAITYPFGVAGVDELPAKYRHVDGVGQQAEATVAQLTTGYQPTMVSMADRALLPESGIDLKEYLNTLERNLIQQALADSGGVVARAADHLAIRRTTLVEKMRKYGLQR